MLFRPFTIGMALLGGAWYVIYREVCQQRAMAQSRAKPEHLQTWEGEGGGVPVGGSRIAAQVESSGAESDSSKGDRLGTKAETRSAGARAS
jgi:hypothetical protein